MSPEICKKIACYLESHYNLRFQSTVWDYRKTNFSFNESSINLKQKPDKDTAIKENYKPMSVKNLYVKTLNKMLTNKINRTLKRSFIMINRGVVYGCKCGWTNAVYKCDALLWQNERQKPYDHLSRYSKICGNIQHPFIIKILNKLGTEQLYLKKMTMCDKFTVNITFNSPT